MEEKAREPIFWHEGVNEKELKSGCDIKDDEKEEKVNKKKRGHCTINIFCGEKRDQLV